MEEVQHQHMGYDRVATMFAPDGHILQVEYAQKTVRLGSASIGIACKDGAVLMSERRNRDSLIVESSANKINKVDENLMVVSAGISSDARVLIDKSRLVCQQHRITYDSPPTTEAVVREICDIKQQFTQYGGARPFGVSLMFAGFEKKKGVLYTTDISGNYLSYKANAIGENDEKLREKLRAEVKKEVSIKEAVKIALDIFKEVIGDRFDISSFDVGILDENGVQITRADSLPFIKKP